MESIDSKKHGAEAKTLLLNRFDKSKISSKLRKQFSQDIDTFFNEIRNRENRVEVVSDYLQNERRTNIRFKSTCWRVAPYSQGAVLTAMVPYWSKGWKSYFRLQDSYEHLSWLGTYFRQYIHRSYAARFIMAACEKEQLVFLPFGDRISHCYDRPTNNFGKIKLLSVVENLSISSDPQYIPGEAFNSYWFTANTFEPAIHQGIAYFLRGQSLLSANFDLEAIVAFDCVLQSLQQLPWPSVYGSPQNSRLDLLNALALGQKYKEISEQMYFLRNNFVAHPGGWRWWDTYEYLDDQIAVEAKKISLRALRKAAAMEIKFRRIEPNPASWSEWLLKNFKSILRAVEFKSSPL